MNTDKAIHLLKHPISVIHLGVEGLAAGLEATGGLAGIAAFVPPAGGDPERMRLLAALHAAPVTVRIAAANEVALSRFMASQPHLVGVGIARDVIPGMASDLFLYAGPPIAWERMSGPLRGAVIGGLMLEKMATDAAEAERLAASGRVRFEPCHHHQSVGPMAGLITPSMPVWILEDKSEAGAGRRTFCTLNEGLGKVLRYGAFGEEVLTRLHFMAATLAPVLEATLRVTGPIDLKMLMAQALQMGDEGHNRNRAATSLLFRELAPVMVKAWDNADEVAQVLTFINKNDHFFLNLSMPMAKCMLMAAEGVPYASMVTVMARNGTDFGIQVASLPGRWFIGPAQQVKGLYFPGFTEADANPDIGDSAITETAGIGGFAMAAAPAIVQFVGGQVADALRYSRKMRRITIGLNRTFSIPSLDFSGTATGIDLLKVEESNILPIINTGIAHLKPGVGQVGAGLTNPPWECFHGALKAFADKCLNQH